MPVDMEPIMSVLTRVLALYGAALSTYICIRTIRSERVRVLGIRRVDAERVAARGVGKIERVSELVRDGPIHEIREGDSPDRPAGGAMGSSRQALPDRRSARYLSRDSNTTARRRR